jgi:hypothetical protein
MKFPQSKIERTERCFLAACSYKRLGQTPIPGSASSTHHDVTGNASAKLMRMVGTIPASTFFSLYKGIKMNSNQKGNNSNQGSNQGSKSGANQGSNKQSGSAGSSSGSRGGNQTGTQGGTHEQHVEAGRQSHKNDGNKQSGNR